MMSVMPRKLLIDCDPGIDDALAVALALFAPELEVVAITATEGNVSAAQASRNVQVIVEQLDPPRYPRLGRADGGDAPLTVDLRRIHGEDGLGNTNFVVSRLHHGHPSEKILADLMREEQENLTILTLGPLTNIARVLAADPSLVSRIGRLVMMGGSVERGGNISAAAEFNIYCDPSSAAAVFGAPTTKILVPLDVTQQLAVGLEFLDSLPPESTRVGRFLRRVLSCLFRSFRQHLGLELVFLHDAIALLVAMHPERFETIEFAGEVETEGTICRGATVFDRRTRPDQRPNMEVVVQLDRNWVHDRLRELLDLAGQKSSDVGS